MIKKLLYFLCFVSLTITAQTTHELDWQIGANGPEMDLTILSGDTVIWTWTDSAPHTVTNVAGSVETFDSGTLSGVGQTFSKTFTALGENPYFCGIHGAASMSGTITVEENLSIDEKSTLEFKILQNPAKYKLTLQLASVQTLKMEVFNVLGKRVLSKEISSLEASIDVSKWSSGVYLVRLSSDAVTQTKRFVKQ